MLPAALLLFLVPSYATDPKLLKPPPFKINPYCMKSWYFNMGCLNMSAPWVTTVHPVTPPIPPHLMQVRTYFHCRKLQFHDRKLIVTFPKIDLGGAPFDPDKMSFFITHGFQNTGEDSWTKVMKDAILNATDANVFIGDWGGGAKVLSYIQAVSDTRLAARQFSNLFQYLVDQRGLNVTRLHLIGHSLGAQIVGLIGKSIPGVFQITALDPAQPMYNVADDSVRLTKNDATFVMGVHSDARIFLPDVGFGLMEEVGHVDFYINTGYGQPNCQYPQILDIPAFTNIFDFFKPLYVIFLEVLLCPHQSAVDIFTEAIQARKCIFWGHAVTMSNLLRGVSNTKGLGFWSQFIAADGTTCGQSNCSPLGLNTYFWPARGTFVLITRGNGPYCIYENSIVNTTAQRDLVVSLQKAMIKVLHIDEGENSTTPLTRNETSGGFIERSPPVINDDNDDDDDDDDDWGKSDGNFDIDENE